MDDHDPEFWRTWQPTMKASLCFVIRQDKILMIRKKRGLGAGKINGPGGRIEAGETALDAAIRETQEELCVTPQDLSQRGELHFQFADGLALHCVVFTAKECLGDPVETEEAIPYWIAPADIPYQEMWEDDQFWLPGMLKGLTFSGYFHFDGDRMLSRHIVWQHPLHS